LDPLKQVKNHFISPKTAYSSLFLTDFGYSVFYHELTVDCLVALLSMVKKDESVNKDYLMRSSFLDNMS